MDKKKVGKELAQIAIVMAAEMVAVVLTNKYLFNHENKEDNNENT